MENVNDIVREQAEDALKKLDAQNVATTEQIADSVLHQAAYWEKAITGKEKLLFVRLFSPVVQREEVFLGNILFNAFLSKAFARAIVDSKLGRAELVANDLENYYFLARTTANVSELTIALRAEVERRLPDLFFGEQDEALGIYGSVETMLDFDKANVEPFPVFIMPQTYAERLERVVRASLLRKIEKSRMERNPTSIMANLAFFYSHDGADMQSPYLFMARLTLKYGIVGANDLRQALNLEKDSELGDESDLKMIIENALKQKEERSFSPSPLRDVLKQAVNGLGSKVDADPDNWRMPYIRDKFLVVGDKDLAAILLDEVSVGYESLSVPKDATANSCRVCGTKPPLAEDKSILMGQNTHKFHNQSVKQKDKDEPKACLRCATCTYLMVKLLGSEAIGQPQVPKTYNLIFHYGKHSDSDVSTLVRQIDLIWERVRTHQQRERDVRDIRSDVKKLKAKLDKEKKDERKAKLTEELEAMQSKQKDAENQVRQESDALFKLCPWLGEPMPPSDNVALDVLAVSNLGTTKTERHILGLGMSGYRMILFILPQLRPPRSKKKGEPPADHYLTQRRFSDSRVTVTALLALLRELCGCDGPFYYQSLPTLTPEGFDPNTFYIRNKAINAEQALKEYEVVTQLAWKLVPQWGEKGFVEKVILAEKLLADPLGTFSAIMRNTPILGVKRDKRQFKPLKGEYRTDWQAQDLTEYSKFIQRLSNLKEVD